jgi:UDP-N-acetylglucosamine diphosphorylase / glucose-1-phosphate thymidylyltransferase / UDP-N-acetylgalactosamine diphosphorylase / glucosamine-1-phosphate N-acetyltransferase / galactosamine-1-phosphate N-acetyltransferase
MIEDHVAGLYDLFPFVLRGLDPWEIVARLSEWLTPFVHPDAVIEPGAIMKPPVVIGAGCFVAAHAYLRGGVVLCDGVTVGPGVEVKSSLIGPGSALAHFNFVGDSILGADVNLEAGAVIANHWNERPDSGRMKFGALIGDHCRIGANAVLSPGTILLPETIVPRLALVDQSRG